MEYTNDIAVRFEGAICSLVLSADAPNGVGKAKSLHEDANEHVEILSKLIAKQIEEKANYFLNADPDEFRAYFDKWMRRSRLHNEGISYD